MAHKQMIEAFRKVSSVNEETLAYVLRDTHIPDEFTQTLKAISDKLVLEVPPKIKKLSITKSKATILNEIMAKIQLCIHNAERDSYNIHLQVSLQILNLTDVPNVPQLQILHANLVASEKVCKVLVMLMRYQRGILYAALHQHCPSLKDFDATLRKDFGIASRTAYEYMKLSGFIKNCPVLLFSELSMSELLKFESDIKKSELAISLKQQISFFFEEKVYYLRGCDIIDMQPLKCDGSHFDQVRNNIDNIMNNFGEQPLEMDIPIPAPRYSMMEHS